MKEKAQSYSNVLKYLAVFEIMSALGNQSCDLCSLQKQNTDLWDDSIILFGTSPKTGDQLQLPIPSDTSAYTYLVAVPQSQTYLFHTHA